MTTNVQQLQRMLLKAQIRIRQMQQLNTPALVENLSGSSEKGSCPNCLRQTTRTESFYRCRWCGKALVWEQQTDQLENPEEAPGIWPDSTGTGG